MRRAISVATGFDPAKEFESCPVHVVVMASKIGPVPYELEEVYPANVGGGGVKHFSPEYYERARPVLAERMSEYITAHRERYEYIASFTDGRYAEVLDEARKLAVASCGKSVDFPIFPVKGGSRILQMGKSKPRTYWAKYWIQLYLEIVDWLDAPQRKDAEARLKKLKVIWE